MSQKETIVHIVEGAHEDNTNHALEPEEETKTNVNNSEVMIS